ncbi:hypothetical protein [Haloarchaeobius amylolyticus]|uniref:hypothetical protein n=1 Tax=Haloarchaeobius amylolyticus TaxID=1198296 RepID=UPI00226EA1A0|nr:hypothetical protein [Haloarchaeobius amylolyticus]
MVRKRTYYRVASVLWFFGSMVGFIAVGLGMLEPTVPASLVPSRAVAFGGGVGVGLAGLAVIQFFRGRAWVRAGRGADLSTQELALPLRTPDLAGEVDGRPVRAYTLSRSTGSGESSSKTTYTRVEADLDEPARTGCLVYPHGDASAGDEALRDLQLPAATVDGVLAMGPSAEFARAVLTPAVVDTLGEADSVGGVYVGDAGGLVQQLVAEEDSVLLGAVAKRAMQSLPGGESSAGIETKGAVLDADMLAEQTRAVATVAEGFEEAARTVEPV